jgi:hypothetical protein
VFESGEGVAACGNGVGWQEMRDVVLKLLQGSEIFFNI